MAIDNLKRRLRRRPASPEERLAFFGHSRDLMWLIGLNVAISVAVMLTLAGCWMADAPTDWLREWLALPSDLRLLGSRPWTVATYMVTQFAPLHLIFNVLWLYWFGRILLLTLPSRFITRLYVGGGLTGALAFVGIGLLGWHHDWLIGSSAAVMAIMTAAAVLMPDRHVQFLLVGAVRLKWVAGAAVLLTFLGIGGGGAGAQSAHIGGVIFGLAMALALRRRATHRGTPPSRAAAGPQRGPERSASPQVRRDATLVSRALYDHRRERIRLDELLDKISTSGYDSLSAREREELQELSQKL